jgi:hypothetical protein
VSTYFLSKWIYKRVRKLLESIFTDDGGDTFYRLSGCGGDGGMKSSSSGEK